MFLSRQLLSLDVVDGDVVSVGRDVAVGTGVDVIKGPVVVRSKGRPRSKRLQPALEKRCSRKRKSRSACEVWERSAQKDVSVVCVCTYLHYIYNLDYDFIPTLFLILIGWYVIFGLVRNIPVLILVLMNLRSLLLNVPSLQLGYRLWLYRYDLAGSSFPFAAFWLSSSCLS